MSGVRYNTIAMVLMASLGLLSPKSFAHKIILDAYVIGSTVEGELGFSDGEVAKHKWLEIVDSQGQAIGRTQTDAEGLFSYQPLSLIDHMFFVNLGAGHVASVHIPASEIALIGGNSKAHSDFRFPNLQATWSAYTTTPLDHQSPLVAQTDRGTAELTKALARLSGEVRQMRKELKTYKEKNDMQQILGAMGYILGLVGLGYYFAARRQIKKQ